jgi:hypothetical protein
MMNALNGFIEEKLLNLHTAMPCKVLSVSGSEATIQPLFMRIDKEGAKPYSPILSVPWVRHRLMVDGITKMYEPVYQSGDKVLVVFSERALDNVLGGKIADPEFNRRHSIEDAVIVGLM